MTTIITRPAGMEKVVRNYVQVQTKLPDPPKIIPPLPGEGSEAFIAWGDQSSFSTDSGDTSDSQYAREAAAGGLGAADMPHVLTKEGNGANRPRETKRNAQDKQPGVVALDMVDAKFEEGKVYSPTDRNVWVKVQRMTSVRFRGTAPFITTDPGGNQHVVYVPVIWKLNLKLPPFPSPPPESTPTP